MELKIPDLTYPVNGQFLIRKAFELAAKKHRGQKRDSGEPYIIHPIAVAEILMNLRAQPRVVAAGLLHDILEDTKESFVELENTFDFDIAKIVSTLTKVKKLDRIRKYHPEEKRKILHHQWLDTIKDVRAAIVKVADRLHNMRTLNYKQSEKQLEISEETVKMYVTLARQMGLDNIENELSGLCERYLDPMLYPNIVRESKKFELEIEEKGYHQNKLHLCLMDL